MAVADLLVLAHVDQRSCPRVVLGVVPCECAADGVILEPIGCQPIREPSEFRISAEENSSGLSNLAKYLGSS